LKDHTLALTAALLTLFNNFIYVMSRNASLDVPMFMFVLLGLTSFTAALQGDIGLGVRRVLLVFSGITFGLAAACKWTAAVSLSVIWLVVIVLLTWHTIQRRKMTEELYVPAKHLQASGLVFLVFSLFAVPLIFYTLAFIPVLKSTHTPFSLAEVVRIHLAMWNMSKGVLGNRALYSPWYRWPFQTTPMRGYSYLIGNPVVMWMGVLAIAVCIARLWKRITLPEGLVVLLYFTSLLQWAVIPRSITYYYYYFPAAMFLSVAIAIALSRGKYLPFQRARGPFILVLAALIVFVYCYQQMAHLSPPWDCMLGCWS